jgi:hypothetical protein
MKHWLAALGLSAALILATPATTPAAAEEPSESEDPSELARGGIGRYHHPSKAP